MLSLCQSFFSLAMIVDQNYDDNYHTADNLYLIPFIIDVYNDNMYSQYLSRLGKILSARVLQPVQFLSYLMRAQQHQRNDRIKSKDENINECAALLFVVFIFYSFRVRAPILGQFRKFLEENKNLTIKEKITRLSQELLNNRFNISTSEPFSKVKSKLEVGKDNVYEIKLKNGGVDCFKQLEYDLFVDLESNCDDILSDYKTGINKSKAAKTKFRKSKHPPNIYIRTKVKEDPLYQILYMPINLQEIFDGLYEMKMITNDEYYAYKNVYCINEPSSSVLFFTIAVFLITAVSFSSNTIHMQSNIEEMGEYSEVNEIMDNAIMVNG